MKQQAGKFITPGDLSITATTEECAMLFSPISINKLTLPNRIIMPAMVSGYAAINGEVTDQLIHYHEERAAGGVGLTIVEATYVELGGNCYNRGLGVDSDEMIRGLAKLVKAIHGHGGRAALQIMHGGRVANPETSRRPRRLVSYIPGLIKHQDGRELDLEEIEYLLECFKKGAARAIEAGFDALEIHGAHGCLIAQFMSPYTNKRTDHYGGSLENRMRFPLEIVRRMREVAGPDFPISFRYSVDEFVPTGVNISMAQEMAKMMVAVGVDMIHVSTGLAESNQYTIPPSPILQGWNAERSAAIKKAIDDKVPVSVAGRINDGPTAKKILAEGQSDLVSMGRALIADPKLPKKIKDGVDISRVPCVACNEGCVGCMAVGFTCAVNPRTGKEALYPLVAADKKKRVLVVGGGPAGCEAALIAGRRGHDVTICDKNDRLGGLVNIAMLPPHKDTFRPLVEFYEYALPAAGVQVELNTEVTADYIKSKGAEVTLLAVGSLPVVPRFCAEAPVMTAQDVLAGSKPVGGKVLILGGGLVGSETAEFLAERGHEVTILEMREDIALDMEPRTRKFLIPNLERLGVKTLLQYEVLSIDCEGQVQVRDRFRRELTLPKFDTLVISLGYRPNTGLVQEVAAAGFDLRLVGDCAKVGKVISAVASGFEAGYDI